MKPNFALTLSHHEIGLLHRTAQGWVSVGVVAVDDPDFSASLSYLRGSALGLEPQGFTTKLVIPASEVLYTTVRAPAQRTADKRAQIARALDGLTPYPVEDLAFDWSGTGPDVAVAVVARETLAEAEAFAVEHRFNPISFVAIPAPGTFGAEPFFGPCDHAQTLLPKNARVERDQDPISLIDPPAPLHAEPDLAPKAPDISDVDDIAEPPQAPPPVADDTLVADPAPVVADAPPVTTPPAPAPDLPSAPEDLLPPSTTVPLPPAAPPAQDPPTEDVPPPAAKPLPDPTQAPKPPAEARTLFLPFDAPPPPAPPENAPQTGLADSPMDDAQTAAPAPEPPAPPVLTPDIAPPPADPAPPLLSVAAPTPGWPLAPPMITVLQDPVADAADETLSWPGEPDPDTDTPQDAPDTAPMTPAPLRAEVKSARKPAKKPKASTPARGAARFMPDRKVTAQPRPEETQASVPQPKSEAEAMTLFGERNQQIGGKPRYLGLMLTLGLLIVLALVAIWASLFLDPGDDTALAPPPTASQTIAALPDDPVAQPLPADPAPEPEPDTTPDPAPITEQTDLAPATIAPDPASGAAPPESIVVSRPDAVLGEPLADLRLSTANPPSPLPGHATALPPFDTLFQFDAEGRILATPEGIVTPDGFRLIAARPDTVPPPRPSALETAPTPLPEPETAAAPETTAQPQPGAGSIAAPMLQTAPEAAPDLVFTPDTQGPTGRPRLRPAEETAPAATDLPPPEPQLETAGDEAANATSPRPRARPASVLAAARRAAEAQQAASLAAAAAAAASAASTAAINAPADNALTIASSRRPAQRPANFARAVEAAVAAAVAPPATTAARRQPEPPAADEDEPEAQVARAAPNIPTSANVAKQATVARALNLGRVALIGVYGTANNRQALVREPGGRMVRVKVGDRFDGGRVTAITASELRYQKGSAVQAIAMPRG